MDISTVKFGLKGRLIFVEQSGLAGYIGRFFAFGI
jgi:hypothetical protein